MLMPARLFLRPFVAGDADAFSRLAGEREIADAMISLPHPLPVEAAEALLAGYASEAATGRAYHAAACLVEDGGLLGGVALREIDRTHRTGELSFWVGRLCRGRGYAVEAGRLALAVAFGEFELNRIAAYHMVSNPASGRVLEKLGFQREGLLRERVFKAGVFQDVLAYALLRRVFYALADATPGA